MADGESEKPQGEENVPQSGTNEPVACFEMELRDTLPGDRAVIAVEQEGKFMWIASRKYIDPKAVEEFREQLERIIGGGWWIQNWPRP